MTNTVEPDPYGGPSAGTTAVPPAQGSILAGVGLTLALHAAAVVACCGIAVLNGDEAVAGFTPFLAIGIVQLLYVVPACVFCAVKHKRRTLNGLLIGAGITFLLNAACVGITLATLSFQ